MLSYETILKLWAEELLCVRTGVEGRFQPDEGDWGDAGLVFGDHLTCVQCQDSGALFFSPSVSLQLTRDSYERTSSASIQQSVAFPH